MLPNESLLQMLLFADYKTLVIAKLVGAHFQHLATKFAEDLAGRHTCEVTFFSDFVTCYDATIDAERRIWYEPGNPASLAVACRELDGVIGPHGVDRLTFFQGTWNMPGVDAIFQDAPPLKYAKDVSLNGLAGASNGGNFEAFMSNFARPKCLRLWLHDDVFRQFNWAFLRQNSACDLRLIKVYTRPSEYFGGRSERSFRDSPVNRGSTVEELLRYCTTLPRLRAGEILKLDFSDNFFSGALGLRIIELLKGSGCGLIFRMTLPDGDNLTLDESDYTVDVDGATVRYTSEKSGIVVEDKGLCITIESTADVPPTMRRRGTDERH
ncbi:hypothetical protein AAVH_34270 [Aphelenchoides avenae]|nr:hypothetical protein AAVH_34270 [Aphelenchus avenae]